MATIEDVARRAEVSVATVSRVINNSNVVKPETARRVWDAVDSLMYVPNRSARNLRRNESRLILIVAPNFTNPYYARILAGICDESRELGYTTLIYSMYYSQSLSEELLTGLFWKNNADGMIIFSCNQYDSWMAELKDKYAIVQCSEYVMGLDTPHVSIDNYKAAYEAVSYLTALGHKRIATISSTNGFISTFYRLEGYKDALKDAGIAFDERYVTRGSNDYSFHSGKKAAAQLFSLPEPPTAVFCVSDILALGAVAMAQDLGLSVPGDVSVVGFDDVDYTTMFRPHLTTIAMPCHELGARSVQVLFGLMSGSGAGPNEVYLPHRLMVRDSCKTLD